MPIIFTFMLARFPAGLVIYWSWNNTLSILQQWVPSCAAPACRGRIWRGREVRPSQPMHPFAPKGLPDVLSLLRWRGPG